MEHASRVSDCHHCGNRTRQWLLETHVFQDEDEIEYTTGEKELRTFDYLACFAVCSTCGGPSLYTTWYEDPSDDLEADFREARLEWPKRRAPTESDRILASAAQFLIEGGEEDAAGVLLTCTLNIWDSGDTWYVGAEVHRGLHIKLTCPRVTYDILRENDHPATEAIRRALDAVLPDRTYIKHFTPQAQLLQIDPEWRNELLEIARGKGVHNQGVVENARFWRGLRFRSASEIKIAEALDLAGVLFLPNCMGRLGEESRVNREADFLICQAGKWGILEVDGEPFHPPSRTVRDHERDRLFRHHGIRVVEHYDAGRCFQEPDRVVEEFLRLLAQS